MPFTTSHPALVLPLKKIAPDHFSLTGLMAGAMSPDLIYFIMADTSYRGLSHSWTGLFLFCLPAGVLFSLAFQRLVKRPLILNSPRPIASRLAELALSRFSLNTPRAWVTLFGSVLLGALSHFLWDAATHGGGEIVKAFPILATPVNLLGFDRPVYRLMQHASSLVGAIFIPVYLLKSGLIRQTTQPVPHPSPYTKLAYWSGGLVFGLAAGATALTWYDNNVSDMATFGLAGWAGFFWWSCLYSLLAQRRRVGGAANKKHEGRSGPTVHNNQ